MTGFGFSALLLSMLRPPSRARLEAELDRRDAVLLRLGVILSAQLSLFLLLTLLAT